MNKKDLLRENAMYKLFLIQLLDNFERNIHDTTDKSLKKYLKTLTVEIESLLGIRGNNDLKIIEEIGEKDEKSND